MEMTNLHAASLGKMDKITQKFPNISKGVLVEEWIQSALEEVGDSGMVSFVENFFKLCLRFIEGSPAECSGICGGDVIIQCSDKDVRSFLKFYGMVLEETGEFVELIVLRETNGQCQRLQITVKASETSPDKIYRWPLPEKREGCVGSTR